MPGGLLSGGEQSKQQFKSPAALAEEQRQHNQEVQRNLKQPNTEDAAIAAAQSALGGGEESAKNEDDIKRLDAYSPEDMKLAEELLFRGYAEKDYPILPKVTITITSMTSSEVELVNEMIYEYANAPREVKDKEGKVVVADPGLSSKVVESQQQMLLLALGFKGMNGGDISPNAGRTLSFIKSGLRKMSDYEIGGDVIKFRETRTELKKILWQRAAELKRVPVSYIDSIAKKRYEFERLMFEITSREDLIPKS